MIKTVDRIVNIMP